MPVHRSACILGALVKRKGPILLHDNFIPQVSMITRQKLQMLNYKVLDHPPCSPELSPTDFRFFKHLGNFLQEKCFRNPKQVEEAFSEFVASSRTTTAIKKIKKKLVFRWQKCILANGSCFD